eukprot:1089918-Prorocentrum_minimum.AAC.2
MDNVDIKEEVEGMVGEAGIEQPVPSLQHTPKKTLTRQDKKKRTKKHKDVENEEDEDDEWE